MYKPTQFLLLCLLLTTRFCLAEQGAFDQRQEQSLRERLVDIQHYRIALGIDDDTQSFTGETSVSLISLVEGLQTLTLDAMDFQVDRVVDEQGNLLEYHQQDGALVISLHQPLNAAEATMLSITYAASDIGTDKNVGLDFRLQTETNPQLANSLNWPNGARHWFPSFDHPSDWATHETIISAKKSYRALANGFLVSDSVNEVTGLRTMHWRQDRPQPTYLYSFAVGPYSVLKDQHGELPLHYWVYPGDEAVGKQVFSRTGEIIGYYENLYGIEFPWVKYDQVIVPGMRGGAESTSATLLGRHVIQQERDGNKGASEWLIAHELAHHWWGNLVGFLDWTHAWISESFASHGEYLFILDDDGVDAGALYLLDYKNSYLKEAREGFIRPIVTNKWDKPNDMFDRHAYEKGAVVLNMFRDIVGTDSYDEILNRFLANHAYSNVSTDDFLEMVTAVTGKNYDWFFEQWLYSPGHPVLDVSYDWNAQAKLLKLTVVQSQDTDDGVPIFRLPINIGVTTSAGKTIHNAWLTEKSQSFEFDSAKPPLLVRFDEGDSLLKEWSFNKPVAELLYQLEHDNVIGRLWAVSELQNRSGDQAVSAALQRVANDDASEIVRQAAQELLSPQ